MTTIVDQRRAFLDAIKADADGERDNSKHLSKDLEAWRIGLIEIMDDLRAQSAAVNANLKANHPRSYKAHELEQDRAAIVDQIYRLESKLRLVKSEIAAQPKPEAKTRPAPPSVDSADAIEAARAHLYAALDLLRALEAES